MHTSANITALSQAYQWGMLLLFTVDAMHRNETKQCTLGNRLSGASVAQIIPYMNPHTPVACSAGREIVVGQMIKIAVAMT